MLWALMIFSFCLVLSWISFSIDALDLVMGSCSFFISSVSSFRFWVLVCRDEDKSVCLFL